MAVSVPAKCIGPNEFRRAWYANIVPIPGTQSEPPPRNGSEFQGLIEYPNFCPSFKCLHQSCLKDLKFCYQRTPEPKYQKLPSSNLESDVKFHHFGPREGLIYDYATK
jgi:hypothetical protein